MEILIESAAQWWMQWTEWLAQFDVYGYPALALARAVGIGLLALLVFYLVKWLVTHRAQRLAERTTSPWDDRLLEMLKQTRWWFLLVLAAYCGSRTLRLPEGTEHFWRITAILALLLQSAVWGRALLDIVAADYVQRRRTRDPAAAMTMAALAWIGKLVLYTVLVLLALENLGVEVTALVAGLGVGGIAVALAVQTILADVLASLSIVLDKPFVPGDFIIVGTQMGTVDHVGWKTTRINSLSGEQISFSNQDLLQSRIHNYARMRERRVVFAIGVTYDTPRQTMQQLPDLFRDIIQRQQSVRFDRAHFKAFGPSSLDFEIVYYVLGADYNLYMNIQQAINLEILEQLETLGVAIAFPTRTVHLTGLKPRPEDAALSP